MVQTYVFHLWIHMVNCVPEFGLLELDYS
jgi:hypothetical protein